MASTASNKKGAGNQKNSGFLMINSAVELIEAAEVIETVEDRNVTLNQTQGSYTVNMNRKV